MHLRVSDGTQHELVLPVLEMQLRNAVQNADIYHSEEINASLELQRGPLSSIERVTARAASEGCTLGNPTIIRR